MRDKLPRGSSVTLNAKPWHMVLTLPGGTAQKLSQGFFADSSPLQNSPSCPGEQGGQSFQFLIELCLTSLCRRELNTVGLGLLSSERPAGQRWPSVSIWEYGFHPYLMGVARCISRVCTDNVIYAKHLFPFWEPGILACSGYTT